MFPGDPRTNVKSRSVSYLHYWVVAWRPQIIPSFFKTNDDFLWTYIFMWTSWVLWSSWISIFLIIDENRAEYIPHPQMNPFFLKLSDFSPAFRSQGKRKDKAHSKILLRLRQASFSPGTTKFYKRSSQCLIQVMSKIRVTHEILLLEPTKGAGREWDAMSFFSSTISTWPVTVWAHVNCCRLFRQLRSASWVWCLCPPDVVEMGLFLWVQRSPPRFTTWWLACAHESVCLSGVYRTAFDCSNWILWCYYWKKKL